MNSFPYAHIEPHETGGYMVEIFYDAQNGWRKTTFTKKGAERFARRKLAKHLKHLQRVAAESVTIR